MKYKVQSPQRLTRKNQPAELPRKTKQKLFTEVFNVYFGGNNLLYPRLGIIAPKKNISKATTRNCVKRVVREWFRLYQNKIEPQDILVIINRKAGMLTKKELTQNLMKLLDELCCLKK